MPLPRMEPWAPQLRRSWRISNPKPLLFFADDNGNRSGSIVFDMKDTSEIPGIAEPWFVAFNAKVSFRPGMNPQDLGKAGPAIERAAKTYAK